MDKTPNEYIRWRYAGGEDREAMATAAAHAVRRRGGRGPRRGGGPRQQRRARSAAAHGRPRRFSHRSPRRSLG